MFQSKHRFLKMQLALTFEILQFGRCFSNEVEYILKKYMYQNYCFQLFSLVCFNLCWQRESALSTSYEKYFLFSKHYDMYYMKT